jgi:hypothetical protein
VQFAARRQRRDRGAPVHAGACDSGHWRVSVAVAALDETCLDWVETVGNRKESDKRWLKMFD